MSQGEDVGPSRAQLDARRAWVYPVVAWLSQFVAATLMQVLHEPTTILVMSISVAVIQLLLILRSVFYGVRALTGRNAEERGVIVPATIGLMISFATLGLIAVVVLVIVVGSMA